MKRWVFFFVLTFSLLIAGFALWERISEAFSSLITPAGSADPVPTLEVRSRPYNLIVPASGELLGLRTTPVMTPRTRRGSLKVSWLAREGTVVSEGAPLVEFDPTDARLALEQSDNQLSSFGYRIEKTEGDARGEMTVLGKDQVAAEEELEYATGQIRKDEDIFSRWEIQESIMSAGLAEFRKGTLEMKVGLREQLTDADLQILDIDKRTAATEKRLAEETLASLNLTSPATGVVIYYPRGLEQLEVGSEVWPGQPLLEIASVDRFRARLQIPEKDISGIQPGLSAIVNLESFPGLQVKATVSQVARIAKQVHRDDPRKYFECDVLLEVSTDILEKLKPGMSVRAEIELSVHPDALVLPRSSVIKEDNTWFVFLAEAGRYREQPVELVGSDHGFYLVTGLQEGDLVCLRHPFEGQKLVLPDFSAPAAPATMERFVIYR